MAGEARDKMRLTLAAVNGISAYSGGGTYAWGRMEQDQPQARPLALQDHRQKIVDALVLHYAADHITVDELERRLDIAHRTHDLADLDRLTADLPAVRAPAPESIPEADRLIGRGARAVADAVRESQTLVAIMGGVERRGTWTPARRNIVICAMGGAELDFRDARFGPGETEVFIFAVMGGAEIVVPPDLSVDVSGLAIMGGFGHQEQNDLPSDEAAPILKVRGFALMGGVDVQVRFPGESAKEATRRRKLENKRRLKGPGV